MQWYKNDYLLECDDVDTVHANKILLKNKNNPFTLYNSTPDDIGIYTCNVTTLLGDMFEEHNIYVPPIANVSLPSSNYFKNGDNISFDCEFKVNLNSVNDKL